METEQLRILTGKTWDLHERMSDNKINRNCRHSRRGGAGEREKMLAIRDSLNDLHNTLIFLQVYIHSFISLINFQSSANLYICFISLSQTQKVKSSEKKQRDEAIARLEESRKLLIHTINECTQINGFLLQEILEFPSNFKGKSIDEQKNKKKQNGISSFLIETTRFGLEFLVIFATIYSSVQFRKCRQKNSKLILESKTHLDVLCGRG